MDAVYDMLDEYEETINELRKDIKDLERRKRDKQEFTMRFIFTLLLFLSVTFSQNVNDKNFKEKVNGGVVVAVFTSEWQEQDLDEKILKGVEGYQDCEIIYVASEQAKKVVKKLRFRNFPSIALFFDGSKKETWKADMDGEVDCSAKDIKGAIDDMLAEDVF